MTIVESPELQKAIQAWQVAEFPLLVGDSDEDLVRVLDESYGGNGLLPSKPFSPTQYDIEDPETAFWEIHDAWSSSSHLEHILDYNLGSVGFQIAASTFGELMLVAAEQHQATLAYSAARILVGTETEAAATYLSLWDNGRPYESPEAIEASFSKDQYGDLSEPTKPCFTSRGSHASPCFVVRDITRRHNGALSVLSGENRVDIAIQDGQHTFTLSTIQPIEGNLVIARLPHEIAAA